MTVGLIIAKKDSQRLINKNWRDYNGKPMFQWNLEKCLRIFDKVYVSSDYNLILDISKELGAIPIKRPPELLDTPNIPVYQHAMKQMKDVDIIVAVQVNSPDIDEKLINDVKYLMEYGFYEIMTCHQNRKIYGSIWALNTKLLKKYPMNRYYFPQPELLLVDKSKDIHFKEDL